MSPTKEASVLVSLCVNHPNNGMPAGRVRAVEFGEDLIMESGALEDRDYPTCSTNENHTRLRVGRRVYGISGYGFHVGNWCWDAAWMSRANARRLAQQLLTRGFEATTWTDGTDLLPSPPGPDQ